MAQKRTKKIVKRDRFAEILDRLQELHDKKAQDYGSDEDSLANIHASVEYGVDPLTAVLVRMNDKEHRIRQFLKKGELANESFLDSLIDKAVYAVIAIQLYEEKEEE